MIHANAQKIIKAPCRRNPESQEDGIPQVAKFGDTITADHTVLNEESESRLHHRCAVVVQDLATHGYRVIRAETRLHNIR